MYTAPVPPKTGPLTQINWTLVAVVAGSAFVGCLLAAAVLLLAGRMIIRREQANALPPEPEPEPRPVLAARSPKRAAARPAQKPTPPARAGVPIPDEVRDEEPDEDKTDDSTDTE